ncbi:MAG: hypothetical protein NC412_00260 [Roseburia sp.]|nr:hypothetical protein [Roseburia sp.]MCM1277814.1 hypothetical protein [Robinsoniella sp.]
MDRNTIFAIGIVIGAIWLYGIIRFYTKKRKGDYIELLATIVDIEYYPPYSKRFGWLLSRYYCKVYQYTENGEYKIYKGEPRYVRRAISITPIFLLKGKRATLYRDIETGEMKEDPNLFEGMWLIWFLLFIFLLFLSALLIFPFLPFYNS